MAIINDCVLDLENSIDVEPAATPWYDLSRYKNNGTITAGGGSWDQLPNGLWVYDCDGVATYIDCGNAASLKIQTAITWEIWCNLDDLVTAVGTHLLFHKGTTGQNGLAAIYTVTPGDVVAQIRFIQPGGGLINYTYTSASGWAHIVAVGDTADMELFANGVSVGTDNGAFTLTDDAQSVKLMGSTATRFTKGKIGGARLYNYNLTAGQIRNRYESRKHLFGVFD